MVKEISFNSISSSQEPSVFIASDLTSHKVASNLYRPLMDYLVNNPLRDDNKLRSVIIALSSFDAFGPNRNGDAFVEDHLLRDNTYRNDAKRPFVQEGFTGPVTVPMYKSFEYFSRPYRQHNNRPDSPFYGKVQQAFYNPEMRRVELITDWDYDSAPDICEKLIKYEPVSTSMGFKCEKGGDVCSICGALAPSRLHYCTHLRNDMGKVYSDGRIVCALNPWGRFFDISHVNTPADRTSRSVAIINIPFDSSKTASYKNDSIVKTVKVPPIQESGFVSPSQISYVQSLSDPDAYKLSVLIKRIKAETVLAPGEFERLQRNRAYADAPNRLPIDALKLLGSIPLDDRASTCAGLGLDLPIEDWQYSGLVNDFPYEASLLREKNIVVMPENVAPYPYSISNYNKEAADKLLGSISDFRNHTILPCFKKHSAEEYKAPKVVSISKLSSDNNSGIRHAAYLAGVYMGASLFLQSDLEKVLGISQGASNAIKNVGVLAAIGAAAASLYPGVKYIPMPFKDALSKKASIDEVYLLSGISGLIGGTPNEGFVSRSIVNGPVREYAQKIASALPIEKVTETKVRFGEKTANYINEYSFDFQTAWNLTS